MKVFKCLVVMVIIFAIPIYTYASLSASDGSAFVTKGEFDSAIADFNSRLTTFEAGINSKIDSQVTSYLDRNGIWSGQKQDLKNIDTPKVGLQTTGGNLSGTYYAIDSSNYLVGLSFTGKQLTEYNNGSENEIISKCSKSGLLLAFFNSQNDGDVNLTCAYYSTSYGRKINQDWQKAQITYNFIFNKTKDTVVETGCVVTRSVIIPMPSTFVLPTYGQGCVNFFVTKDQKISVKTTASYIQGTVRAITSSAGPFYEYLRFTDISIY